MTTTELADLVFDPASWTGKIAYKKVRPNDNEPVFKPSKRAEDADYDICASIDTLCKAGATTPVSTNLAVEFPYGWEGKIETKSGLGKKGLTVLGGVIDSGYSGELVILTYNTGKDDHLFKAGMKVAQLKLRQASPHFEFVEVDRELKKSERMGNGFGSLGQ